MADAASTNTNARKEGAVYLADQKEKLAAVIKAEEWQVENVLGPQKRPYEAAVVDYSNRCGGKTLPQAQFDACNNEKNQLDSRKSQIENWWTTYSADWNRQNVDPINNVIKQQNVRIAQLNDIVKKSAEAYNAAMQRSQQLRIHIAFIETVFRKSCAKTPGADSTFTAQEALKYCNSVPWDGANTRLPPLYQYQGTGGTSSN